MDVFLTARHLEGLLNEVAPELADVAEGWSFLERIAVLDAVETAKAGASLQDVGLVALEETK